MNLKFTLKAVINIGYMSSEDMISRENRERVSLLASFGTSTKRQRKKSDRKRKVRGRKHGKGRMRKERHRAALRAVE